MNAPSTPLVVDRAGIDALIGLLIADGFSVIGPTVREGVIAYDSVESTADLPIGVGDDQAPGSYRLVDRDDAGLFGYVVGSDSWKRFLHPPVAVVWKGSRTNGKVENEPLEPAPRYAFFGARPCELAAIDIQDEVFLGGPGPGDAVYGSRRSGAFLVAVNCARPAANCFCTSLDTGPGATEGFDIALTEVLTNGRHHFLVESGSVEGEALLVRLDQARQAEEAEVGEARGVVTAAAAAISKRLDTEDLKDLLFANAINPQWDEVATRCLSCTNCTMVCPTCFCSTMEDQQSLDGSTVDRVRLWDSCFSLDFSYIHGGPVRSSPTARYRQWLTHKLASWQEQFGTIGCVGCGRCITWCPVGIDITAEVAAIRASDLREQAISVGEPAARR
jgi:ferredoxin